MTSKNQQHAVPIPLGRVVLPGLLYGSVGLALSITLQWIGMYKRSDIWLFDILHKPMFHEGVAELPSVLLVVIVAAIFCYGISFAILDSPNLWRRVILGITGIVLTLAMVPAFAVWNVYFSPFVQLVGVFWSWFCVVIYTQHHLMPCEHLCVGIPESDLEPEQLQTIDKNIEEPVMLQKEESRKSLEDTYKPKA